MFCFSGTNCSKKDCNDFLYSIGLQWKIFRAKWHFRGPKGSRSLLILLVTCLSFSYQHNGLYKLVELAQPSLGKLDQWKSMVIIAIILEATPKLLFPLAGWLADAKLGRHKVLSAGLFMTWMSAVILLLVSVLHDSLECFKGYIIQVLIAIIYIISAFGTAFFHANLVPFGIDQMEDCSSDEISSFVHWYYFARNVNLGLILQLTLAGIPSNSGVYKYEHWVSLIQVFCLTIGVCLLFIFSKDLKTDPLIYNPIRVIRVITQYILKHNKPVKYRSARTYLSEIQPVRSDFAKKSYGGIYEDDVVEEVVTFWWFMVFLIPIGMFSTIFFIVSYKLLRSKVCLFWYLWCLSVYLPGCLSVYLSLCFLVCLSDVCMDAFMYVCVYLVYVSMYSGFYSFLFISL